MAPRNFDDTYNVKFLKRHRFETYEQKPLRNGSLVAPATVDVDIGPRRVWLVVFRDTF